MAKADRVARRTKRRLGRAAKKIIKNTPTPREQAAGGGVARRKARRLARAQKKMKRNLPNSPSPAPMPTDQLPPKRTTAYGGGRMKYSKGGEAMPKAKPC